jgi:hypothetical protein
MRGVSGVWHCGAAGTGDALHRELLMPRRPLTVSTITVLLVLGSSAAVAGSLDRRPRIHHPRGYGGEFAFVDVFIGNSDGHVP